jgi:hypothetical protein
VARHENALATQKLAFANSKWNANQLCVVDHDP